jgi:hypothetical protein
VLVSHVPVEVLLSCETRLRPFVGFAVGQRTFVTLVAMAFCEMALEVSASHKTLTHATWFWAHKRPWFRTTLRAARLDIRKVLTISDIQDTYMRV